MTQAANRPIPRFFLGLLAATVVATAALADEAATVVELMRNGRASAAMSAADRELAKNPRNPQIRFLKALLQHEAGHHALAIATYQRLIADYPGLPEPYHNLAALYAGLGERDKARTTLELAARASRSLAVQHEKLGDVYAHLATQTYRQALQSDHAGTEAPRQLPLIRQLIRGPDFAATPPADRRGEPGCAAREPFA